MKLSKQQIRQFQHTIFDWWKKNQRDLPWRHTHDPYHILVSEVMLQQTQVLRVITKYREFIERYPDIQSLAQAKTADVLRLWKGMGYNRRALYLKKTAEIVVREYKGIFPHDEASLLKLPGIGKYTSRAIMVFAYKKDVAMVDTNIRQIITHFFFDDEVQSEKSIQEIADQLVPQGKSWEWHQALMDYGAANNAQFIMNNAQYKKTNIPFRESNRFYRGRIMDFLREGEWKEEKLVQELVQTYDKPKEFFVGIIQGLEKDGLLRSKKDFLILPE